jgi:hypothetical protein
VLRLVAHLPASAIEPLVTVEAKDFLDRESDETAAMKPPVAGR